MKQLLLFFILLFSINSFSQEQKTPFLKDIVSQFPNVRDIAISPNGNEVMFTAQSVLGNLSAIIEVKKVDGNWNTAQIASFSGMHFDLEPFYSHDGLKLYFASRRPLDQTQTEQKDFDIWYVERKTIDSKWSDAKNMGAPINTEHGEFYPSIAKNGNFYFTRDNPNLKRRDDIYVSTLSNGNYTEAKALPDTINSESFEYNAFIAPDESYLIFGGYNRKDGLGSGDLYISYKIENGWAEAKNMGEQVNSKQMDYCPLVIDNILYMTCRLDNTKTENKQPLTIDELLNEFNRFDNGKSRLYMVNLDETLD